MIRSNRDQYIPAHTTEEVRKALLQEKKRVEKILGKKISRSMIVHHLLSEGLRRRGHRHIEITDLGVD